MGPLRDGVLFVFNLNVINRISIKLESHANMCRSAEEQTGDRESSTIDIHLEGLVEVYVNIVRKTRKCSSTMYLRKGLWREYSNAVVRSANRSKSPKQSILIWFSQY
jgi:hypothetical protein